MSDIPPKPSAALRLTKIFRAAPFTAIVMLSWASMLLGQMAGWSVSDAGGGFWQVTLMPAYAVLTLVSFIVPTSAGWLTAPVALILVVLVDGFFALLRRSMVWVAENAPGPESRE